MYRWVLTALSGYHMLVKSFGFSEKNWVKPEIPTYINPNRDQTIAQAVKLQKTKDDITKPYQDLKAALRRMHDVYSTTKYFRNAFRRYVEMKRVIKEVLRILVRCPDLPVQKRNESEENFVQRLQFCISQLPFGDPRPSTPNAGGIATIVGQTATMAQQAKENQYAQLCKRKTQDELRHDIETFQREICRISKKYYDLREVATNELKMVYTSSKLYPIIPRYNLLKRSIKETLRSPAYIEVCHELSDED